MSVTILRGKELAGRIEERVARGVAELRTRYRAPCVTVVLVGNNPASEVYVRRKAKACERAGIRMNLVRLPERCGEEQILRQVDEANRADEIDGILVQLPLPKDVDDRRILESIRPEKDVDGFHPWNLGRLMQGCPVFVPCTVAGIIELLKDAGIRITGRRVVVVGRSIVVGLPLANLLLRRSDEGNATVTVCHSRTPDLGAVTRTAEILVVAAGRAGLVTGDMVAEGCVVVDVGVNRVDDPGTKRGYRLAGDVDFESVSLKASAITPVPGGVGPLTVAMLLENTLGAAQMKFDRSRSA
ncbi:MAG: bifunctional methylenetetrahydrofolate dehydrogenase/methenyltetrahydrofolate cyclohydrolase FolD [Candidatus Eisenbacteria sp.]|nr:bifunctional methylenetetrahydrofolate dehydrogenase/methenyltetrahydrofolate cyclohydrolase FolD [Candidatus Eisenbacteria bacterium]